MKSIEDILIGDDIGHGTDTPGKGYAEFKEHTFNSSIGEIYRTEMLELGFKSNNIVMAQQPNSLEVELNDRYNIYDYNDFYLSFHADANNSHEPDGMTIYYWQNSEKGLKLANVFKDEFEKSGININFRAIDESQLGEWNEFGILREPKSPGILIEHGFFTNTHDRNEMSKDNVQRMFAKTWAKASVSYLVEEGILSEKDLKGGSMERIDLKFLSDGNIVIDIDKSSYDKLSDRLEGHQILEPEEVLYKYCGYILKKGMTNDGNIMLLQKALSELKYYNMSFDNSFGEGCHSAVIKAQIDSGLQANGVVNEITANAIDGLLKSQTNSEMPSDWRPYIKWGGKNLVSYTKFGQSRYVQYMMKSLGYDIVSDGHFWNNSAKTVRIFQSDSGFEVNGIIDEENYNYLTYKYSEWQESQDLLVDYYDNQTLVTRVRKEESSMDVMLCRQPVEYMKSVYNRLNEKPLLVMNAGLFGMKNGVTLSYLKDDGNLVTDGVYSKWVIGTDKSGNIDMFGMNWEKQNNNESDIVDCIGASPSLVVGGVKNIDKTGLDYGFLYYKHPRTGLGLNSKYIGGVCIQGRNSSKGYYGVTIDQMADIFIELDFEDGIGLDGGGSTYFMDEFGNKLDDDTDNRAIDSVVLLYRK